MTELRLAFRQLLTHPGFALIAILTLGLGIGANTAVFSVVHAVLLEPFPYPDAEQLMFVGETQEGSDERTPVVYPDFLEWREQNHSFRQLIWIDARSASLSGIESPANVRVARGSADMWPMLELPPLLGRTFTVNEDQPGAEPVAVLSYAAWQRHFGGANDVLGRSLMLDQQAYTIIGVMPERFQFWAGDVWIPAGLEADGNIMRNRLIRNNYWVVGRLKDGVSPEAAEGDLQQISARIASAYPDTNRGVSASLQPLADNAGGSLKSTLLVLLAAVAAVLLIACVNVANLLLARASGRERDYSVRLALGMTSWRLLRGLLIENLPLALLGALAGLAFAYGGLQLLLSLLPADVVPAESRIQLNAPVLGFAMLLAIGCTLVFGVIVGYSRSVRLSVESLRRAGTGGGARQQRLRSVLVVTEVALALTLMITAGLLLSGLRDMSARDPGFDASHMLVLPVSLSETRYPGGLAATQFFDGLRQRLSALPGVDTVAASHNMPMMNGSSIPLLVDGKAYTELSQLRSVQMHLTLGDFISAQGLKLLRGRVLGENDGAGSPPVIVLNEAAVRQFLPEGNPIGQRVKLGLPENLITPGLLPDDADNFWWSEVVGVVSDARHYGLNADAPPAAYMPIAQSWTSPMFRNAMFLTLRTRVEPMSLAPQVRAALQEMDRDQPLDAVTDMQSLVDRSLGQTRFTTALIGTFAGLALLLSAIGIYGVVAWHVGQRSREISLRLAVGARPQALVRLELWRGLKLVLVGVLVGLVLSFAAGNTLAQSLEGVRAFDGVLYVAVSLLLVAVALLASWVPARRALKVDPMFGLRAE